MIEKLLALMPNTYLIVQLASVDYVKDVLPKMSEEVRKKFASRVTIILKNCKLGIAVKNKIKACFPGIDMET